MSIQSEHPWVPTDDFGTRLLLVRRELGLSMKAAADRCGLHYSTWSTWENGRKPANMGAVVKAIAEGLGVRREWLMWGGTLGTPESPRPDQPDEGSEEVRREGLEPPTRCVEAIFGLTRVDELAVRRARKAAATQIVPAAVAG